MNLNSTNSKTVTVKAKWKASDFYTITYMQEMSRAICNTATKPSALATNITFTKSTSTSLVPRTVLIDSRDNSKYLVSRLADGNCWMSQNLGLDLSSSKTLNNITTDLNSKTEWTPENSTQNNTGVVWKVDGSDGARSYRFNSSEAYYINGKTASSTATGTTDTYLYEKGGVLYNWYAATAGSGTSSIINDTINDSICPKNWKIPENAGTSSFTNLIVDTYSIPSTSEGIGRLLSNPFNYILTGILNYSDGARSMSGTGSFYWSATANSNKNNAFRLSIYTATYNTQINTSLGLGAYRGNGLSVRCVAR